MELEGIGSFQAAVLLPVNVAAQTLKQAPKLARHMIIAIDVTNTCKPRPAVGRLMFAIGLARLVTPFFLCSVMSHETAEWKWYRILGSINTTGFGSCIKSKSKFFA